MGEGGTVAESNVEGLWRGRALTRLVTRMGGMALVILAGACAGLHPIRLAQPEPGAVAALDRLSPHPCNGAVAAALAGARIPTSQVDGVVYGVVQGLEDIVGYGAWLSLRDQSGAVVVDMDAGCRPSQIYARGGARLPNEAG